MCQNGRPTFTFSFVTNYCTSGRQRAKSKGGGGTPQTPLGSLRLLRSKSRLLPTFPVGMCTLKLIDSTDFWIHLNHILHCYRYLYWRTLHLQYICIVALMMYFYWLKLIRFLNLRHKFQSLGQLWAGTCRSCDQWHSIHVATARKCVWSKHYCFFDRSSLSEA